MEEMGLSRLDSEAGETSDVLQQLEVYEGLNEQHGRYTSLLENAVAHSRSVREHIFEKVRQEYEARKSNLEEEREKLGDLLRDNLRSFVRERERIASASVADQDLLEEIDFRVLVGERSSETIAEERNELSHRLRQYAVELERMEEILGAFVRAGLSSPYTETEDASALTDLDPAPSHAAPEGAPPEAPEWEVQEPSAADPGRSEPDGPESVACETPEPGGAFQVLAQDTDPSGEDCPVVQCLEMPSEGGGEEIGDVLDDGPDGTGRQNSPSYMTGYLTAVDGSRRGERFPLLCSNITLGTSPGSDIRLSDRGIRNFHAQIYFKDRRYYLENLDAAGRCFLNGSQGSLMEIKDGDIIQLGEVSFQVELTDVN